MRFSGSCGSCQAGSLSMACRSVAQQPRPSKRSPASTARRCDHALDCRRGDHVVELRQWLGQPAASSKRWFFKAQLARCHRIQLCLGHGLDGCQLQFVAGRSGQCSVSFSNRAVALWVRDTIGCIWSIQFLLAGLREKAFAVLPWRLRDGLNRHDHCCHPGAGTPWGG